MSTAVALVKAKLNIVQVYSDEQSTIIAGLPSLEGGEADFFSMPSAGEAQIDLEELEQLDAAMAAAALAASDDDDGDGGGGAMDDTEAVPAPSTAVR